MFTENSLATAEIARIFGSELLGVQEKARTDAGSQPEILRMHPKQFLTSSPQQQGIKRQQEALLMQQLQREAEAAHPLPEAVAPEPPIATIPPQPSSFVSPPVQPPVQATSFFESEELAKLNKNLERIATVLEKSIELFAQMSANK